MYQYRLTKSRLLFDLYVAYETACKGKRNKPYIKQFEENLHANLSELADLLWSGRYEPQQSVCFIVNHPKKREVFAAHFRDRIVHHLFFNYTHHLFENTFIHDNYSCIKKRGTHFGVNRLDRHIRQESHGYTRPCYVLQMDIMGYFMHIERILVRNTVIDSLRSMKNHKVDKDNPQTWGETIDYDFVEYLADKIALYDPTVNCIFRSHPKEWIGLPDSKSLFKVKKGCGLPIGNLTSQLFSNVFLNRLDQFVKRVLKCRHYGRYVDDFYIVSHDKEYIHSIIPKIEKFLTEELHLSVNKGKTKITNINQGVEFLGMFVKPHRIYNANKSVSRIKRQLYDWAYTAPNDKNIVSSVNSFLGAFSHCNSFNLRKELFDNIPKLSTIGFFNQSYTKFIPYSKII